MFLLTGNGKEEEAEEKVEEDGTEEDKIVEDGNLDSVLVEDLNMDGEEEDNPLLKEEKCQRIPSTESYAP